MEEQTLVLIKPDAMVKNLAGNIIQEINSSGLKMVAMKLVNVQKELAEKHYEELKDKPFFEDVIKHLTGELHNNENVIAIVYRGKNAITKIRKIAGSTHPEEADFTSLRGRYGRFHSKTDCLETVIHSSDSKESAKKEIELWFNDDEIIN